MIKRHECSCIIFLLNDLLNAFYYAVNNFNNARAGVLRCLRGLANKKSAE